MEFQIMLRIAIVYFSQTDVTEQIAKSIASGANQEDGIMVLEHRIDGHEIIEGRFENAALFEQLKSCNAIIFGSPTYTQATSRCEFQDV